MNFNMNIGLNRVKSKFLVINTDPIELDGVTKIFTTNLNPNLWYSLKNDLRRIGLELLGTFENNSNELNNNLIRIGEDLISYDDNCGPTYFMDNYFVEHFDSIVDACAESNNIHWSNKFIIFGLVGQGKSFEQFDIYEFYYIWKTFRNNIFGSSLNLDLNPNANKKIDLVEISNNIIFIGFKNSD